MKKIKNFEEIEKEISDLTYYEKPEFVFVVKKQSFRKIKDFLEKYDELYLPERILVGENYVNEARKLEDYLEKNLNKEIRDKIEWHLIGPLQKSNINKALKIFNTIQTIDSYETAKEINDKIKRNFSEKEIEVYLQINIGKEEEKSGIFLEIDLIKKECLKISELENLNLKGLMCIEPFFEKNQEENSREYFSKMKEIFDSLNYEGFGLKVLSMGMSNTYKTAIQEGGNMVRLGRSIFGEREESHLRGV